MPASLTELVTTRTQAQEEASLLSTLKSNDFPVTDWRSGGAAQTLVKAIGAALADHGALIPSVAKGGFVKLAIELDPVWLDLIAEQFYDLERARATYTRQNLEVSCAAGLGPQTVNDGFMVAAQPSGNRYVYNGAAVVVPDGGSVVIAVQAEAPGSGYDDPAGSIVDQVTPLPGVSVTNRNTDFGGLSGSVAAKNPANRGSGAIAPGGGPPARKRLYTLTVTASGAAGSTGTIKIEWVEDGVASAISVSPIPAAYIVTDDANFVLTFSNGVGVGFVVGDVHTFETPGTPLLAAGVDDESNASLAARCIGRWPSLGENIVAEKYVEWIRRASLDNAFGIEKVIPRPSALIAGQTDIVVATAAGAPSGGVIATLQAYVNARDGIADTALVTGAVNVNINMSGTVTVRLEQLAAAQIAADNAWLQYIADLPIGGDTATGSPGVVRLAELVQALMDAGATDYQSLQLNGAGVNFALAANEVAVVPAGQRPSLALTWNAVA